MPSATALRVRQAPVIDGRLDEPDWKASNAVERDAIGTHNNSVHFGALWDNENLYVGVDVVDASLSTGAEHTWDDDSVEVYVDGNHSGGREYDDHDTQVVLVWNGSGVARNGGGEATGVRAAWAERDGGYSVEFAIPWSRLDVHPKAGMVIGFDLSNNDCDGGGKRSSKLMWSTPDDEAWRDTSKFGDLRLVGVEGEEEATDIHR